MDTENSVAATARLDLASTALDRLFDRLIRITNWACTAYVVVIASIGDEPARLLAPVLILAGGLLWLVLRRRVSQQFGFSVYVWSIWMAIALQSAIRGGPVNTVLHANIVLVLMGGWLLGLRQAFALLVASIAWVGFLTVAVLRAWLTPAAMGPGLGYWFAMATIWIAGYVVLRQVFMDHQRGTSEITALNAQLLAQVKALAQQEAATATNQRKVAQLMMASPLPITVANFSSGVYVDVNPAWERFFQFSREQVIGRTSVDLGFWKDMGERQAWIDEFSAQGRVSGHEVTFLMRDGSPRIFMLSSERFQYGDEDCVLTMSVDVTERKRLESDLKAANSGLEQRVNERTVALDRSNQELLQAVQRLSAAQDELVQSEKLASLGSLVAGVAHELNTPLGNALVTATTMSSDIEAMSQKFSSAEMKRSTLADFLERMAAGAKLTERSLVRGAGLIASFKQVAVDQVSERRRTFELAQVLTEVIDTLRPNIKVLAQNIELKLDFHPNVSVDGFPGPLGQVVINLITNSATHAFEGRDSGRITVSTRPLGADAVLLVVEDDGVGISSEHIGQIFDPFFTTKMGRGGSGLGLSISRRIAAKVLGGQIRLTSPPGQGARFELLLPLKSPAVVF